MTLHRFYLKQTQHAGDMIKIIDKNIINQLLNVFRFKIGSSFVVFFGDEMEHVVEISSFSKKEIICKVQETRKGIVQKKEITLAFSVLKKENSELVLQKCTELGIINFVPIISERTIKTGWKKDRLEKILIEAAEQSGFAKVPTLEEEPFALKRYIEHYIKTNENVSGLVVLDFDGMPMNNVKNLIKISSILVGPEGGWSPAEVEMFKTKNIQSISLGEQVLRAETACMAVAASLL